MRIGFIGLGAMGLPMAGHLAAAGHDVTVASRGRGPIDAAVALGAVDGGSPRGVAEASEVVFLCVPNSPEVVEVVDAMLPVLGAGTTVVDCSTIDPEVERTQHARVSETGAHYLDAPLSGGTAGRMREHSRSWSAATRAPWPRPSRRSSPSPGSWSTSADPAWARSSSCATR